MSSFDDIFTLLPSNNPGISNGNTSGMGPADTAPGFGNNPFFPSSTDIQKSLGLSHENTAQKIGATAGSVLGGAAGTAIGGPLGGAIGSQLGQMAAPLIVGGAQDIIGALGKKKAKSYMPGMEDPMERRRLTELDNKRKTFETGSAYASQLKQIRNIQANTITGATRASGGNSGALLNAINNIGLNTADAYAKVAGAGTERQDAYDMQYGGLLDSMAKRRAALQMQNYTQASVDAAEQKKSGNQTLMSLLGIAQNFNNPNSVMSAPKTANGGYDFSSFLAPNPQYNQLNVPPLRF